VRNTYRHQVKRNEGKRKLGRTGIGKECIIKKNLKEIGFKIVQLIKIA
jgi:hypothetical protein